MPDIKTEIDAAASSAWAQRVEALAREINQIPTPDAPAIDFVAACLIVAGATLTHALSRVHPNARPASVIVLLDAISEQMAIWAKLNAPPDPADALILPRGIRH